MIHARSGKRSSIVAASLLCLSAMMFVAAGCKSEVAVGENGEPKGGVLRAGLPPRALIATQGSGTVEYTPQQSGRLFLYDATKDKIVGVYQVAANQRFAMTASSSRATVNGNEVQVEKLDTAHLYQVYFLADEPGSSSSNSSTSGSPFRDSGR